MSGESNKFLVKTHKAAPPSWKYNLQQWLPSFLFLPLELFSLLLCGIALLLLHFSLCELFVLLMWMCCLLRYFKSGKVQLHCSVCSTDILLHHIQHSIHMMFITLCWQRLKMYFAGYKLQNICKIRREIMTHKEHSLNIWMKVLVSFASVVLAERGVHRLGRLEDKWEIERLVLVFWYHSCGSAAACSLHPFSLQRQKQRLTTTEKYSHFKFVTGSGD